MTKKIKTSPLVSVIIPCYNSQDTILMTLISLENQSLKEFEAIVVNDGSSDSSDEIIRNYIKTSSINFNYIIQENSGVSSARNTGLIHAKGKYITFLDSDDIYHKDFLKKLTNLMEKKTVDTAFCNYTRDIKNLEINGYYENEDKITVLNHNDLMMSFMHRKGPCAFFTFIYLREIIEKHKLEFPIDTKYGEDLEFTWKYLSYCKSGAYLDRALHGYMDNPNSVMNNVKWSMVDSIESISRVEEHLKCVNDSFYQQFSNYMHARTLWSVMKNFSIAGKKDLFNRLILKYDVKNSMKILLKTNNILIKLSALIFLIHPNLFYRIVRLKINR